MSIRHTLLSALVISTIGLWGSTAAAADLEGVWDVSVDGGQSGSIDFPMTVEQFIVFIDVTEDRPSGTVTGSGISPGPLVIWSDDAGSFFVGRADDPQEATEISGIFVFNFEGMFISSWSATKQVAVPQ